jgi:hypothetical protein
MMAIIMAIARMSPRAARTRADDRLRRIHPFIDSDRRITL